MGTPLDFRPLNNKVITRKKGREGEKNIERGKINIFYVV